MSFNTDEAQRAATDILKSALSSGALKLRGPGHDEDANEYNSKLDAKYLNNVFTEIVKNIVSQ
ncbi:hypothetical protein [Janthinobacterium sp. PSPC2-1]|uniref:hypothetical protein n=1 Tax=unclassified Janthinobacterium TaxID=2610881 RepID=UPI003CEDEB9D